jgi:hypothetical protein
MNEDEYTSTSYTTKGWNICVEWRDGTTSWLPLIDVKNSFPVHLAEYAVTHDLQHYPDFSWWVNLLLKKRKAFIKQQNLLTRKDPINLG